MIYELSSNDLKSYIKSYSRRNIIDSIDNDNIDKIYLKNIPKRKIKLLKYLSKYGVIGGSMALKLYGVLQRDVDDIDLICTDSAYTNLKTVHKEYQGDIGYYFFSQLCENHINRLVVSKFNLSNFKIDIFIKDTINYNEYDGIKLQPLNEIIKEKSLIMREKDETDLKEILSRIESNQYIIKTNRSLFRKVFEPFYWWV